MAYFETLKTYLYNDYLSGNPKKSEVIANANTPGNVAILPNSNNRAIIIDDNDNIYLQSYDTIVLILEKKNKKIVKKWDGYSVTTLKHINEFLKVFSGVQFNKKSWLNFSEMYI